MLSDTICQQARLARDPRFDGLFFIAVKSTGIFCRAICPAKSPSEQQVRYFETAEAASLAGYRPCLRCRPDSAPGSSAWQGKQTTMQRALRLIDDGALQQSNQQQLAARLGISDRYLRQLFQHHLGLAPKQYALLQQVLFAKKLLHETTLTINEIAFQAGFNSVRRFNDAFLQQLKLSPSTIRRRKTTSAGVIELELSYRPPFAWQKMLQFWRARTLNGIDWVNGNSYGRTFSFQQTDGWFEVCDTDHNCLRLTLYWPAEKGLFSLIKQLRRMLDLDANMLQIEQTLLLHPLFSGGIIHGLRIPGLWSSWEAGVRAILGQQVSVAGARTQLNRLVQSLGQPLQQDKYLFPTPQAVLASDLDMIKVPQLRRETLKALAQCMLQQPDTPPEQWLSIKGIGPWTVNYAKMRGISDSDIWLAGDLGVKKALQKSGSADADPILLSPWRSYATFQLWFMLGD